MLRVGVPTATIDEITDAFGSAPVVTLADLSDHGVSGWDIARIRKLAVQPQAPTASGAGAGAGSGVVDLAAGGGHGGGGTGGRLVTPAPVHGRDHVSGQYKAGWRGHGQGQVVACVSEDRVSCVRQNSWWEMSAVLSCVLRALVFGETSL